MVRHRSLWTLAPIALALGIASNGGRALAEPPGFSLRLESRHAWRPPFGLERVGKGRELIVAADDRPRAGQYRLVLLDGGKELLRDTLAWPEKAPFIVRIDPREASEAVLLGRDAKTGRESELARLRLDLPEIEADAIATADRLTNPVDLGAILVPNGWLLLGPGDEAAIDVAAISRRDRPDAQVRAWLESDPAQEITGSIPLVGRGVRKLRLRVPKSRTTADRDSLHVVLLDGHSQELWRKSIPVMLVREPPRWPRFGASYTKLRYDAPISVRDPGDGTYSSMNYEDGWAPSLRDVVVSLPDGSRFVFWRGSSYIPFWAGEYNTGACYEWAEMLSRPEGAVDCVEPLMDKELRYGRVEIVESTPACVHVRWTYQSTDLKYQVWGDSAVEDYVFYPDGFGVRTLSLRSSPDARYELSEFIVLTPAATYPLAVLPESLVEAVDRDGKKTVFRFPFEQSKSDDPRTSLTLPVIYRLKPHRRETRSAIYANPLETRPAAILFGPFRDHGQLVTPCYWGSHWPLARGNATGSAINDRVGLTPCHNSVMSWGDANPPAFASSTFNSIDVQGQSRPMALRRWAWLIGYSDASDATLARWTRGFASPPSIRVKGGSVDPDSYVPERRAIRLRTQGRSLAIQIEPRPVCVNPVFELEGPSVGGLVAKLDGARLRERGFAWDGRRLWIDAIFEKPALLELEFNADRP